MIDVEGISRFKQVMIIFEITDLTIKSINGPCPLAPPGGKFQIPPNSKIDYHRSVGTWLFPIILTTS